ncbi:MAG TPA: hypothetical protein VNX86_16340 [Rhizomicrobium sp.]|nr:hypothetical protein [Rhizomicrobium sp.]
MIYGIAVLIIALVATFMAYCAWFALVWGFNPLWLFPLYLVGLAICAAAIFFALMLARN